MMLSRTLLVGLGLALGCFPSRNASQERPVVVMVSVDGLAARYLDDPMAPMPTLRRLAQEGARASGMIMAFPSQTRPGHVSLMTGTWPRRHGIVGNVYMDRRTKQRIDYRDTDAAELVRAQTIHDAAHEAGLVTAAVNWPGTRGSPALDWNLPPTRGEHPFAMMTPGLRDQLESAGIPVGDFADWRRNVSQDGAMLDSGFARVARHILTSARPNLLLVHFVMADAVQHAYGPESEEAYRALGNLDNHIREIWEALQEPSFRGNATLFVVADHGFASRDKVIQPNVILRQEGLITTNDEGEIVDRKVFLVDLGGAAAVYIFEQERRDEYIALVREKLGSLEGLDRLIGPEEFAELGLPDLADNPYQADLLLAAKPGYSFSTAASGSEAVVPRRRSRGRHGHLPTQPLLHATFVAAGAHIRPGTRLETIYAVDVAPTIAAILGVELPGSSGRVLTEILR